MSTSYAVSQPCSFQSFLGAVAITSVKALAGAACGAIVSLPSVVRRAAVIVAMIWAAVLADLAELVSGLVTVLTWCAGIAAIVGAMALLLANPAVVLAGLVIVGYGWATCPKAARK